MGVDRRGFLRAFIGSVAITAAGLPLAAPKLGCQWCGSEAQPSVNGSCPGCGAPRRPLPKLIDEQFAGSIRIWTCEQTEPIEFRTPASLFYMKGPGAVSEHNITLHAERSMTIYRYQLVWPNGTVKSTYHRSFVLYPNDDWNLKIEMHCD